jgi:hypothetical protein
MELAEKSVHWRILVNILVDLRYVDWMELAEKSVHWLILVNIVVDLQVV